MAGGKKYNSDRSGTEVEGRVERILCRDTPDFAMTTTDSADSSMSTTEVIPMSDGMMVGCYGMFMYNIILFCIFCYIYTV